MQRFKCLDDNCHKGRSLTSNSRQGSKSSHQVDTKKIQTTINSHFWLVLWLSVDNKQLYKVLKREMFWFVAVNRPWLWQHQFTNLEMVWEAISVSRVSSMDPPSSLSSVILMSGWFLGTISNEMSASPFLRDSES